MNFAIISSLLRRDHGSIENPNVPITGQNLTAWQVFGGRNTVDAGVSVTDQTSCELPPIWGGLNVISSGFAKLPMNCRRRLSPQGSEVDTMHAGHRIMQQPNRIMRPFQFKQLAMFQALMYGNHTSLIMRNRMAEPVELLPSAPGQTEVFTRNGEYWYALWFDNTKVLAPAINVFHIKAMGFSGVLGEALTRYGRQSIGQGLALNKYLASFFKNSGRPAAVLSHPGHLDDDAAQRIRDSWDAMYSGSANAGKTAVLEEDMKLQMLGFNLKDMEAVNQANFTVRDVCRLLNLQPHKLADLENASLRSVPEANQQFLDDTLEPWLTQFEEECFEKLLTEQEKEQNSHYFDFDTKKLMRMNPRERMDTLRVGIDGMIINKNEARDELGLNAVPGGEKFVNPNTSNGPTPEPTGDTTPAPADDNDRAERERQHVRSILVNEAYRFIKRIGVRARKEAKFDATFQSWFEDTLVSEYRAQFIAALAPACGLAAYDRRGIFDAAEAVDSALVEIQTDLNTAYSTATRDMFAGAVDTVMIRHEQELADKMADAILEDNHVRCHAA